MSRYPLIADHGMVGDLQTAALVSSDGVVDWFAVPRFDSPSVFASLLDHARGGYFKLAPTHPDSETRQLYYPDSAVLITRFMSPEGVCEVIDWMTPITDPTPTDRHILYRGIRVMRGSVTLKMECRPRFDYARVSHELHVDGENAVFRSSAGTAYLQARNIPISRDGHDVRGEVILHAGDLAGVAFTVCGPDGAAPGPRTVEGIIGDAWSTIDYWQKWVRGSSYRGRWAGAVNRSAITLKLLTYHPTGAPVAAATMGLPE